MPLTGGKRDRMVLESVLRHVEGYLDSLGWFDSGRQHQPIVVVDAYPGDGEDGAEVALNTMAFSYGDTYQTMVELGTNAETHTAPIYIDFYGESDGLTRHILGDIYAFLGLNPVLAVYDYDMATPTQDFTVEIVEESVSKGFPSRATNPWQKHWGIITMLVEDERANA